MEGREGEREGKEDDHTNSQTRLTREWKMLVREVGCQKNAGGTQEGRKERGKRRHCYIYRHRMWVVGVELVHKLRG